MRVLVVTNLFPNAREPLFSQFNRQQFSALGEQCSVEVLAPIPWYPAASRLAAGSRAGRLVGAPANDSIDGLSVTYPRYLHVPKIGHWFSGPLFAAGLLPHVRRYRGRVDVVLGAWAYPDGWAAILLARALGVPAVIKLHGSDINVIAQMPGPKLWLKGMLPRATRVVAVSRRLGDRAVELGVDPSRIDLVFNGVNQELFFPRDRAACRASLGLPDDGKLILYVGSLLDTKGIGELLDAFDAVAAADDAVRLCIVGDGPMRHACEQRAERWGGRLVVAGPQPLSAVAEYMGACDLLTLPSWNEGTPNVVLEALTSGRRVVATDVGGIPDLIDDPVLGTLVQRKDTAGLSRALAEAVRHDYDPADIARRGGRGDWAESARNLRNVLASAVAGVH